MTLTRTHSLYELRTRAEAALAAGKAFAFEAVGGDRVTIAYAAGGSFLTVAHREADGTTMQSQTESAVSHSHMVRRFTYMSGRLAESAKSRTHTLDDLLRAGAIAGIEQAAETLKARIPEVPNLGTDAEIAEICHAREAYLAVLNLLNEDIDEIAGNRESQS